MAVVVRPFADSDAGGVAAMLRLSVRDIASRDYAPAQIAAWLERLPDAQMLTARCSDGRWCWVAVDDDRVIGFTDLEPDGHIDLLYVAPAGSGRGVAAALTDALIAQSHALALDRLYVEASEAARRFYLKRGFVDTGRRDFMIGDVAIHNYAMERRF